MKYFFVWLGLFLAILSAWHFLFPVAYVSGKVENEIHGFGSPLAPALAFKSEFTMGRDGFQPKPATPQAPAGLKPEELQAWTAMAQRDTREPALVPTFPEHYSNGTQVRSQGMAVTLKPLGSRAATAQVENGKLVYHDAYTSTDSMQVVSEGKSEEFLLLHDSRAPQKFEYDISAASGVKDISLQDNSIHFKNLQGQQLQIEAPWLVETGGQKVANAVHWELSYPNGSTQPRLALVVANAKRLHYPVVIDPTWVVTLGSMNTARSNFTATLLNNGQVLVAGGGYSSGLTASAELYNPGTGTWTATGSLNYARYNFTSTLLLNGKVLVEGGSGNTGLLTSAELYNPVTGTWTVTGSMHTGRYEQTATLLPNGKVLVAAGSGLTSAELYDPGSGTWTVTGSLATGRYLHSATLLPNGQVFVAGGANGGVGFATCELYNPATGLWSATGNLTTARFLQNATLLPSGKVLITGGYNGSTSLGSCELYNPTTGTFSTTGSLTTARANINAVLLPNGQVLVVGGDRYPSGSTNTLASAEIYSPATGTWTVTGSLNTAREVHTATLLPGGLVLVAGGYNFTGTTQNILASSELYNPASGSFSTAGSLNNARQLATATLLPNGQVLVAGGSGTTSSELFNPATGSWTATGNLNYARSAQTATLLPNGEVLVAGGLGSGNNLASAEMYNPAAGIWTTTGNLNTARQDHTATLLPNGQVLVAAGAGHSSAELYNPANGTWTFTGSLNSPRYDFTSTLLPDGEVMAVGGTPGTWSNSAELYNPSTGIWTYTGNLNTGRAFQSATLLSSGQVLITGGSGSSGYLASAELYNPATSTWTTAGSLSTARYEQTATLLSSGQVLVAGGYNGSTLTSAELFNPGLGYTSATQPQLNTVSFVSSAAALSLAGTNFTGFSEASGGSFNNSASNTPVVQLQSLANEQVINVPLDPSQGFTSTSFTSLAPTGLVPGYALLTMFVNGTPSLSQIVPYGLITPQTISAFATIPTQTYGVAPFAITPPTATSGLPVTVTVQSGPATISGNTVTITGAGTVVLAADQAGNASYSPAPEVTTSFTVSQAAQTITFSTIATQTYGVAPFTLGATASSGLAVSYSLVSGPANLSGTNNSTVTITGAGTVTIQASQAGNTNYLAAPNVNQTFTVNPASQTISAFATIPTQTFGVAPFAITSPTATSGLPVTVSVKSGAASISGNTLTITGAGTVVLAADQSGNTNYTAAPEVITSFTVNQAAQTINFPTIATQTYGVAPFTLGATASSGLPVSYSLVSGPANLSGTNNSTVTITGAGSVIIQASQAGNTNYLAASNVNQSFTVNQASQTISAFATIPTQTFGVAPFAITIPSATSGLPVAVTVQSGPANISGNTVTITGAGTVVLAADQSGNTNYNAAPEVTTSFTVNQAAQTINFPTIATQTFGVAPFTLGATASSGLPVSYSLVSGPANLSGTNNSTLTITGAGTVIIQASQAGNTNYLAASNVNQSFTVNQASQTISAFATIPTQTFGVAPFAVTPPLATSGLPVTVSVKSGPANISGNTLTITGAGTVVLAADQTGNTNYSPAPEVTTSFAVNPAPQSISAFAAIPTQTYGVAPFLITLPTATSGLPVTVTVKSGPANISGNTVTITGAGTVVLAADQSGNTNYNAAPEVTTSFTVNQAAQTINFPTIATQTYGVAPFTLGATSSSGLAVSYSLVSGPANLSGTNNSTVTVTGAGTVIIQAGQAGNANYLAAPNVNQSFTVNPATQTISAFAPIPTQTLGVAPFLITPPTASSGLPVTVTVKSGPATISGVAVTITGLGLVVLAADQAGNANYTAAPEVTTSFSVAQATWFIPNGSLNSAREGQTATLLSNGQVLLAGGDIGSGYLASAELYNPATGTCSATGSLNIARTSHTATLLTTGQLLVVGGKNGSGYVATAELYDPLSGTWTPTGSLNTARSAHTATLLSNGQVLVAGGNGVSGVLASAELYNPATGIWTGTGNFSTARSLHTATLLPNGQVLATGGYTGGSYLTGAELFNPSTGIWTVTGSLTTGRSAHTATLLSNGQVLIAAGNVSSGVLASAELYNPTLGTFANTGSLNAGRGSHTATLLPNGQVLVAGGYNGTSYLAGSEVYSQATGTWTITGSLNYPRYEHTATLLPNGQVLVAGGYNGSSYLTGVELYNPVAGSFSASGSLKAARYEQSATLLPNGQVLVVGGENSTGFLTSAELYNPANGAWTFTGGLGSARESQTATLLPNGQVLVAGGDTGSGYLASAQLYNPSTGTWTSTGSLNTARTEHTATSLSNGQVLIAGGSGNAGILASAELFDPTAGTWTPTGNLSIARILHTATLLPNGQVLVAGGYSGSSYLASAQLFNPATGTWTATGSLNTPRLRHTATLLPNGQVLVTGGEGSSGALASAELYNPATGTWTATGSLNHARYAQTATFLLNGQVLVTGGYDNNLGSFVVTAESYNPATGKWTVTGNLNTARYEHTATLLPSGQLLVAGGSNGSALTGSELFDPGLGYGSSTQPQLNTISSVNTASDLGLTGTNFTGVSEASGGATNNSSSAIPVVQLESLSNEQVINVPLDPGHGFSSSSFTSSPPTGLVPGYVLLTMFVNGTPSLSQIVSYSSGVAPVITSIAPPSTAFVGTAYNFTYTATGSPTPTFAVNPGALPGGLNLSTSGVISGAPTTPGLYTGSVQASNGVAPAAAQNFSITVYSTYASWATQEGLTGNQALQTAIISSDGITNLMKYALGLNPATTYNPGSPSLPIVKIQNISGVNYLTLTFTGTAADVTYLVQSSSDMVNWSTDYSCRGAPPPGTLTVQDTQAITASSKRFMRLLVSP